MAACPAPADPGTREDPSGPPHCPAVTATTTSIRDEIFNGIPTFRTENAISWPNFGVSRSKFVQVLIFLLFQLKVFQFWRKKTFLKVKIGLI